MPPRSMKESGCADRRHRLMGQVVLQIALLVPLVAQQPGLRPADQPGQTVNRRVPDVERPPAYPVFSAEPDDAEITRARVFSEPLVPLGPTPPSVNENAALARAITVYLAEGQPEQVAPLLAFLAQHPQSRWRASLHANLGMVYRQAGFYTRALASWNQAWNLARGFTDRRGRAVADMAVGHWLDLMTTFGNLSALEARLAELEGRDIGGSAGSRVWSARAGAAFLRDRHHEAMSSGAAALEILWRAVGRRGREAVLPTALNDTHASAAGMSLQALADLALEIGLQGQAAIMTAADIPVPAILHFKMNHYAVVLSQANGRYLIRDPLQGGDLWVSRAALAEEMTGYVWVPGQASQGVRSVESAEAVNVVGYCKPGASNLGEWGPSSCDPLDPRCQPPEGGEGPKASCDPGDPSCCPQPGMPVYTFNPVQASLRIIDIPVGHRPPVGPEVWFRLHYNHRDIILPQLFAFGNVGPQWTFNWIAYVRDNPNAPNAPVFVERESSSERYVSPDTNGVYPTDWRTRATLVRTSTDPIRYERRRRDGGLEVFALSDGATTAGRRVFLTEATDPQGHTLTFTYDQQVRLVAVTDALGQVTTLEYEHPTDALLITSVTDPFGRDAHLEYDGDGRLIAITDVIGLRSSVVYGPGDFVAALTTPYGTTTFRREDNPTLFEDFAFIEATDPVGGAERLEFRWEASELDDTETTVPTGFSAFNTDLDHYVTLYWDKRAMAADPLDIESARQINWLLSNLGVVGAHPTAVSIPHSIKRPQEGRVWYRYPGQTEQSARNVGWWSRPSVIARVLDDQTSQIWETDYNTNGFVTARRDPVGRETTYTYDTNGMDLLEIRQTTSSGSDLLAEYDDYTSEHRPETMTDAAGETTTFTYNTGGQILTVTNPLNETTTYAYDEDGYLSSVTAPIESAETTYTYDGYGRQQTVTTPDEYTVTTAYDLLDRVTSVTYPDSTVEQTTYARLDAVAFTDRSGRVTRSWYDPMGRPVATRDPLGRVIRQEWCACGSLDALVDGKGQRTEWERDLQGRVVREVRADGTTDTVYTYETTTSRRKTVTDPEDQVTTYSYAADDRVIGLAFSNETIATADVTFTYDDDYPRLTTMVDGTGTTTYGYHAAGGLGGGQLASVNGPLTDDTITYAYDEIGRMTSRLVDGVGLEYLYDGLGRITEEENPLGTFTYDYETGTSRLTDVTYPNDQTSEYLYDDDEGDHRLLTIHHQYPNASTLSKFDYTYDAVGNITTWQQQADSDPAVLWRYEYDAADQLTAAVKESAGGMPTVLKRYAYTYDPAGSRTSEQIDDAIVAATHDELNRLLTHSAGGPMIFAGTVNEPSSVTIQGEPATVDGSNAFRGTAVTESGTNTVTVAATDGSGNPTVQQYEVDVSGAGKTFTYDANGNMTSDGTRTFEWDARNQLVAVEVGTHRSEFTYDGLQRRTRTVEKESGATQSDAKIIWCETEICEERAADGTTVTRRAFALGEQISGVAHFFATDHLGSVREVTDSTVTLLGRYVFDPWGRSTLVLGSDVTTVSYTAHERHVASGLMLALYRAYDAENAQWLREDPLGYSDGPNRLGYVRNNPILLWDPDGAQAAVGAIVGGMVAGPPGALAGVVVTTITGVIVGQLITDALQQKDADITDTPDSYPPFEGRPGSTVRGERQTRRYGDDGFPDVDTDGHSDHGAGRPHTHEWARPSTGGPPTEKDRGKGRSWRSDDPPPPRVCKL